MCICEGIDHDIDAHNKVTGRSVDSLSHTHIHDLSVFRSILEKRIPSFHCPLAENFGWEVGKVVGGQVVNVIGEATVAKPGGGEVRRLQINEPKPGWITAANFEQAK
jgi:hypothetical protein